MDWVKTRRRVLLAALTFATLPAAVCRGESAAWLQGPTIDSWLYPNAIDPGTRNRAPSFGNAEIDPLTNEFFTYGANEPARLGSDIMGFGTSDLIQSGLDPSQYAITSVTVTAYAQKSGIGPLYYTAQPMTPADLLAEAQGGGIDSQQPMELFGVGFREGYEGFAFDGRSGDAYFDESVSPYSGADSTYVAYPVVGDGEGDYHDVSNNYTGGFSATEESGFTGAFNAVPWAIGTANKSEGDELTGATQFTFSVDLAQPGVLDYLQRSLAEGGIGFMISSMHSGGQPETGNGGAYPDWRTREGASGIAYPTLTIEYELLSAPGDYNADGFVDSLDYDAWTLAYGTSVAPGSGADGNGDGFVDAADYTIWRDAQSGDASAFAVPEPSAGVYALAALTTAGFCAGTISFTTPRRRRNG